MPELRPLRAALPEEPAVLREPLWDDGSSLGESPTGGAHLSPLSEVVWGEPPGLPPDSALERCITHFEQGKEKVGEKRREELEKRLKNLGKLQTCEEVAMTMRIDAPCALAAAALGEDTDAFPALFTADPNGAPLRCLLTEPGEARVSAKRAATDPLAARKEVVDGTAFKKRMTELRKVCNKDGTWKPLEGEFRCLLCRVRFTGKKAKQDLEEHERGARHRDGRRSPDYEDERRRREGRAGFDEGEEEDAMSDTQTVVEDPHTDSDCSNEEAIERTFTAATLPARRQLWEAPAPKPAPKPSSRTAPAAKPTGKKAAGKSGGRTGMGAPGTADSSDDDRYDHHRPRNTTAQPTAAPNNAGARAGGRQPGGRPAGGGGGGGDADVPGLESSSGSEQGDGSDG